MMTLKELGHVGRMLTSFLLSFGMCFKSLAGRKLLRIYVQGQLSDLQRKNCEHTGAEHTGATHRSMQHRAHQC